MHPAVIEAHGDGTLQQIHNGHKSAAERQWLSDEELGLLTLLEQRTG